MQDYESRLKHAREQMGRLDIDYLLIGPSADLRYLIGFHINPSERPLLLILPRVGDPALLIPRFLSERIRKEGLESILTPLLWAETDSPFQQLATYLPDRGAGLTFAVNEHLYAGFLISLQEAMPDARFVDGGRVMEPIRIIKSDVEIYSLEQAIQATDAAFHELLAIQLVGLNERQILSHFQQLAREKGMDRANRGVVAIGPNSSSSYHPMTDRRASPGDSILIDIGAEKAGYHCELTRTIHIGQPDEQFQQIHHHVWQANQCAFNRVKPGATAESVDTAARNYLQSVGLGEYFTHRTGHGIGMDPHEHPYIVAGNNLRLKPGMVFSIEPGVYLPEKFGVRIEDIVLVTSHGARRLTQSPHELQIINPSSTG